MHWIYTSQNRVLWRAVLNAIKNLQVTKKGGKFLKRLFDSHDALSLLELDGLLFSAYNEVTNM
jgi:hypothetical protein